MRHAAGLHHRFHVSKVQIDECRHSNQVADALNALTKHIIRNAEGFQHGGSLADHLQQTIVGDHHQGIHPLLQISNAHFRILHALLAFKGKRLGYHGNGQCTDVPGNLCHDRCCAGAGAAAHACGDEDQVRAFQCLSDFFPALFRCPATHFRYCACAQSLGQLFADLDLRLCIGKCQCLTICIDRNKLYPSESGVHHAVHRIVAAAAAANNLDRSKAGLVILLKLDHVSSP